MNSILRFSFIRLHISESLSSSRFWEVQQHKRSRSLGRFVHHKILGGQTYSTTFILNTVKHGYKIPLISEPPLYYAKNNKSSLFNKDFVEDSIRKLLRNKCIVETERPPYWVNSLTVASSKLRFVIDLRHVNKYVLKQKFKYENFKTEIFEENDYFFTFDLKSGYHYVPINVEQQKYLSFSWKIEGKTKYFNFLVLPFGLSSACYLFTKLLRHLVKKWRVRGIKCVMYIDEGIAGSPSLQLTTKIRDTWRYGRRSSKRRIHSLTSRIQISHHRIEKFG